MSRILPVFPVLIVYEDGSVGIFHDLSDWSGDVDQWFWSSGSEYIIDTTGSTFIQEGERDTSGRPISVPDWKLCSKKSETEILDIIVRSAGDKWLNRRNLNSIAEPLNRLRYIFDSFGRFDSA